MPYIALYRKWRPRTFSDLVGQEHISRTLSQAITSGRIGHAYLFCGPRGTGKTSTAKILAMALNCEHRQGAEPCGKCESCRRIMDGSAMDVFEIDAASNRGIDEIRDLRETVKFAPAEGRYKIYIIDEVHMLTAEAFNALLKTLEEPPEHVVFLLATTEAHKVPPTIQSRCQRFDFRRITVGEIQARLRCICDQMQAPADDNALELIALQADGGLRDALSILDQCISLSDGTVTEAQVQDMLGLVGHSWIYRMTTALAKGKSQDVLNLIAELLQGGKDLKQIVSELELHLRSLMIYQAAGTVEGLDLYAEPVDVLKEQSAFWPAETLMQMLARLHDCAQELRWSPQPRITVEIALLALARGDIGGTENLDAAMAAAKASATQAAQKTQAGGDDARIAKLEASIAALQAQLAARPAAPAGTTAAVAATAAKATTAATATQPAIPPAGSGSAGMTNGAVPSSGTVGNAGSAAPAAVSPADAAIWKQLLARFEGNGPILALIGPQTFQGFQGFSGHRCYLHFSTPMLGKMILRPRNRPKVEQALTELCGHPMTLDVSWDEPGAGIPRPQPVKREKPKLPPLPYTKEALGAKELHVDDVPQEDRAAIANFLQYAGGGELLEHPPKPPQGAKLVPPKGKAAPAPEPPSPAASDAPPALSDQDAPPEEV